VVALHPGNDLLALQVAELSPSQLQHHSGSTAPSAGGLSRKRARATWGLAAAGTAHLGAQLSCMCLYTGPSKHSWVVGSSYSHTLELLLVLPHGGGLRHVASLPASSSLQQVRLDKGLAGPEDEASGASHAVAEDIAVAACTELPGRETVLDVLVSYRDGKVVMFRVVVPRLAALAEALVQAAGEQRVGKEAVPGQQQQQAVAGSSALSTVLPGLGVACYMTGFTEAGSAPCRLIGPLEQAGQRQQQQQQDVGMEGQQQARKLRFLLQGSQLLMLEVAGLSCSSCCMTAAAMLGDVWQAVPLSLPHAGRPLGKEPRKQGAEGQGCFCLGHRPVLLYSCTAAVCLSGWSCPHSPHAHLHSA
jgi:hypothetical protein